MKKVVPLLVAFAAVVICFLSGYMLRGFIEPAQTHSAMSDAMHQMIAGLDGKAGAEFDHAFLEEMIVHHEGAVQMAREAERRGAHQELKDFAKAIIDVQSAEIAQMRSWQEAWLSH